MFKWFSLRKQAYTKSNYWKALCVNIEEDLLLSEVKKIKRTSKKLTSNELILRAQAFMVEHHIEMERSHLFDLLSVHNLLKRKYLRRRKHPKSLHWIRKYPNLLKMPVEQKDQVWISDIVPWKIKDTYVYVSFIADAYSKEILGYHIAKCIEQIEPIVALNQALICVKDNVMNLEQLIHHSLHGHQYCAFQYVKRLKEEGIKISMSEPLNFEKLIFTNEISDLIKSKYLQQYIVKSKNEAELVMDYTVKAYNKDLLRKQIYKKELEKEAIENNKKAGLLSFLTLNWKLEF